MRLTVILLFLSNIVLGQSIDKIEMRSSILQQQRELHIYKPSDFGKDKEKKYHIIYVFDSQSRNLFDYVHATMAFLKPYSADYIIVGVISPYIPERNWNRNVEMLPKPDNPSTAKGYKGNVGKADSLLLFVEFELIPYVSKEFKGLSDRTIIGHSNSATFALYSLSNKPNLFQNIIALCPNFAYDKVYLNRELLALKCENLKNRKFIFLSNANENDNNGFKNWKKEREVFYHTLNEHPCKDKLHFQKVELLNQEHMKSYPEGALIGLRGLVEYNYYNFENAKTLLRFLEEYDSEKITSDVINVIAYENYYVDKNELAIDLLNWGIELFPNDDNLYDSKGEILEYIGKKIEAEQAYRMSIIILKKNKEKFEKKEFNERLNSYLERIRKIK